MQRFTKCALQKTFWGGFRCIIYLFHTATGVDYLRPKMNPTDECFLSSAHKISNIKSIETKENEELCPCSIDNKVSAWCLLFWRSQRALCWGNHRPLAERNHSLTCSRLTQKRKQPRNVFVKSFKWLLEHNVLEDDLSIDLQFVYSWINCSFGGVLWVWSLRRVRSFI